MRALLIGAAIATMTAAASAQMVYQGPGTYSTYGEQTYGPNSSQQTYGNQTNTHGPGGDVTYQAYGNQTYGSDGSIYQRYGNQTYGPNGSSSQTYGNQTYIHDPDGTTHVCQTYGNQVYCN